MHYIERKIGLQFKKTGAILILGLCGITQFLCPFAPDFRGNIGERKMCIRDRDAALAKLNDKIDYAINVEVPDDNIINRMGGRRACVGCGATYHVVFNAPKLEDT